MTKAEVKALKGIINKNGRYTTYYSSKTESLSIRVHEYTDDNNDVELEKHRINELLEMIKDTPFKKELVHRKYQGYWHDICVVVK